MLSRSQRTPRPNPKLDITDFYYYLGVLEGGPLMRGLEAVFKNGPLSFKLCFLAFINLKITEQEIAQEYRGAAYKVAPIRHAALAFTSAATTILLTTVLESSLGWWAAPALMVGGKLLVDKARGKNLDFSPQAAQGYYNNLASWWNRPQPVTAPTLETRTNLNRQPRV